jgi:hypothetical protein
VTAQSEAKFDEWAIVELMGHRKLAGRVTEAAWPPGWIRLDIPSDDGTYATQFYSPGAGYCMTPVTEELARAVAKRARPAPVTRWELPAPEPAYEPCDEDDDEENPL